MTMTAEARIRRIEIITLRRRRWTYNEIGQCYGITRERVRQIINTKPRPRKVPQLGVRDQQRSKIDGKLSRLYRAGMTANYLATIADVSWYQASRWLLEHHPTATGKRQKFRLIRKSQPVTYTAARLKRLKMRRETYQNHLARISQDIEQSAAANIASRLRTAIGSIDAEIARYSERGHSAGLAA